jgi:GTP-binding protein
VRRLRWKGPVFRISALARKGTTELCEAIMTRLEALNEAEAQEAAVE